MRPLPKSLYRYMLVYAFAIALICAAGYHFIAAQLLQPTADSSTLTAAGKRIADGHFADTSLPNDWLNQAIMHFVQQSDIAESDQARLEISIKTMLQHTAQTVFNKTIDSSNLLEQLVSAYLLYSSEVIPSQQLLELAHIERDELNAKHPDLFTAVQLLLTWRNTLLSADFMQPYLKRRRAVVAQWLLKPKLMDMLSYRKPIDINENKYLYAAPKVDEGIIFEAYRLFEPNWSQLNDDLLVVPASNPMFEHEPLGQQFAKRVKHYGERFRMHDRRAQQVVRLEYNLQENPRFRKIDINIALDLYRQLSLADMSAIEFYAFYKMLSDMVVVAMPSYVKEQGTYTNFQHYLRARFFPQLFATCKQTGINPLHFMLELVISAFNMRDINNYNIDIDQTQNQAVVALAVRGVEQVEPAIPLRDMIYYFMTASSKGDWLEKSVAKLRIALLGSNILYGKDQVSLYELLRSELLTYSIKDVDSEVLAMGIMKYPTLFSADIQHSALQIDHLLKQAEDEQAALKLLVKNYLEHYGASLDVFIRPTQFPAMQDAAWSMIGYDRAKLPFEKTYQYNMLWRHMTERYSPNIYVRRLNKSLVSAYKHARQDVIEELQNSYRQDPTKAREQFLADQLDNPQFFAAFQEKDFARTLLDRSMSLAYQHYYPAPSIKSILFFNDEYRETMQALQNEADAQRMQMADIETSIKRFTAIKEQQFIANLDLYAELTRQDGEFNLELQLSLAAAWHGMMQKQFEEKLMVRAAELGLPLPDPTQPAYQRLLYLSVIANREVAVMDNLTNESNYPHLANGLQPPYNYAETDQWLLAFWQKLIELQMLPKDELYDYDYVMGYIMAVKRYQPDDSRYITLPQYQELGPIFNRIYGPYYSSLHRSSESLLPILNEGRFFDLLWLRDKKVFSHRTPERLIPAGANGG
ncbi:MAG: hypothetical protein SFT92_01900 [Rickettsiales bacterium]|nr:hypothetical protein [Rickettsiales bacterium]